MKWKSLYIILIGFLIYFLMPNMALSQSLSGTIWNVTIPAISQKPYNFIFANTGNKGNVLMPNGKLADFTWKEDGKGNWSIQITQIINGTQKYETFNGKISGNSGTGQYISSSDKNKILPLTMTKK